MQELKGSIRVFCRVRPILDKSSSEDGAVYCLEKGQFVGRRVYLETSSGIWAFICSFYLYNTITNGRGWRWGWGWGGWG